MQNGRPPAAVPFKVLLCGRCGPTLVGVAVTGYSHLVHLLRHKYKVSGDFYLQQDDGTIVCDEEYFKLLEPKTTLRVVMLRPPPRLPCSTQPVDIVAQMNPAIAAFQRGAAVPAYSPRGPVAPLTLRTSSPHCSIISPTSTQRLTNRPSFQQHHVPPIDPLHLHFRPPAGQPVLLSPPPPPLRLMGPQAVQAVYPHLHSMAPSLCLNSKPPVPQPHLQYNHQQRLIATGTTPPPPPPPPPPPGIIPMVPSMTQALTHYPVPSQAGERQSSVKMVVNASPPRHANVNINLSPQQPANKNISMSLVSKLQITSITGNAIMSADDTPLSNAPVEPLPAQDPQIPAANPTAYHTSLPHPQMVHRLLPHHRTVQGQTGSKTQTAPFLQIPPCQHQARPAIDHVIPPLPLLSPSPSPSPPPPLPDQEDEIQTSTSPPEIIDITFSDLEELGVCVSDSEKELEEPKTKTPSDELCSSTEDHHSSNRELSEEKLAEKKEELPKTATPRPLLVVKTVSETDVADCQGISEDSDDEDDKQLCIAEQTVSDVVEREETTVPLDKRPSSPLSKPRDLSELPTSVPIDTKPLSADNETKLNTILDRNERSNLHSPDEGYISSTSPVGATPSHNIFSAFVASALPFQNYETNDPLAPEEERRGNEESIASQPVRSGNMRSEEEEQREDMYTSPEGSILDDDGEEDFVMNLDNVFSPIHFSDISGSEEAPTPIHFSDISSCPSNSEDTPAPIHFSDISSCYSSSEEPETAAPGQQELIVRINRDLLSLPSQQAPTFKKSISRGRIASFPLAERPRKKRLRQRKHFSTSKADSDRDRDGDPLYRPTGKLVCRKFRRKLRRKFVVRIPLSILSVGREVVTNLEPDEESYTSDDSATILEKLASNRIQQRLEPRVPQIIRLQPLCPAPSSPSLSPKDMNNFALPSSPAPVPDELDIAENLTLNTMCSSSEFKVCLQQLQEVWREVEEQNTIVDVGEEIELYDISNSSAEKTGIELLNLTPSINIPVTNEKSSILHFPILESKATVISSECLETWEDWNIEVDSTIISTITSGN